MHTVRSGHHKNFAFSQTHLFSKNKYKWSVTPTVSSFSRTPKKNSFTERNPGSKQNANAKSEINGFSLFLNNDMLTEIMSHCKPIFLLAKKLKI